MTRPAGMSSSGQARAQAADAPSTSRAGTSRGGGRPVPPILSTYPYPGWPDMPTELMAWQYGAISPTPIPLEPPMPSDRYAIDPDSPLVCSTIFHSSFRCLDILLFTDDYELIFAATARVDGGGGWTGGHSRGHGPAEGGTVVYRGHSDAFMVRSAAGQATWASLGSWAIWAISRSWVIRAFSGGWAIRAFLGSWAI
ncbi:uncharacterized protein LOC114291267 [Camellia sinensis]|uniref:uncharacterized protein LOC114291267 n=1 Tax=Camellia sinensis TaxID=4442 RepID=UPI001036BA57|nr:uncharacterized protein LOC114291267 [Camellia sinensis]